ncbi:MAG: hypothetical protein U0800_19255 [Isosphaeraceae bacterium]
MTLDENDAPRKGRENSLKHGLSGAGVVLPEALRLQVDRRRIAYARVFPPVDQLDVDDIDAAALGWCRFLECRSERTHRAAIRSEMAVGKWGLLRQIDAQERARRLGHNPPSVVLRLKASFGGVLWMLDQWRLLKLALETSEAGAWTVKQLERANNLAGVDRLFRENDPHRIRDGSAEDRRKLVEGQVAELKALLADGELERLDEIERQATIRADHALNDPSYERLCLYEQRAFRMYERAIGRLRERHPDAMPGKRKRLDRRSAEEFEEQVDRTIAEEAAGEPDPPLESIADRPAALPVADPIDPPSAPLLASERDDLKAAFVARILSAESQSRVSDAEMRLLDRRGRDAFREWHSETVPELDLDTAIRGLIGYTRLQAELGNYHDPNGDFFAEAKARLDQEQAERDKERRRRKAIKAARKRNRGR